MLLSAATNSEGGFLIVPTLFSDVTIFMDAATRYAYVVNFSHVDILRLNARTTTVIGVTEMEDLDPDSDSSPDYDELDSTGNETSTRYTPTAVTTTVRNDKNKEATSVSMRKASRMRWTSLKSDRQLIKWCKRSIPRPLPLPTTR